MRTHSTMIPGLLALILLAGRADALSPPFLQFTKETLPVGGTFVQHPGNASQYYVVPAAAITQHKENFGKRSGLYYSPPDGGGKFGLLTDRFDFRQLVINPATQRLYVHIVWRHAYMRPEGLVGQDRVLIASSEDGVKWKDITPPDPPNKRPTDHPIAVNLHGVTLVQDPEHEKRICLVVDRAFGFVMRALDDEHTKWEIVSLREWKEQQPTTQPASRPAGQSAAG
jgi:hypothetical protein